MEAAAQALKALKVPEGFDPLGLFYVNIRVYIAKARTSKLLTPLGDCDNYAKGVLDAITKDGRWWADDKLVSQLVVTKTFATETAPPGYHVILQQVDR
jgi:hypothetical protein